MSETEHWFCSPGIGLGEVRRGAERAADTRGTRQTIHMHKLGEPCVEACGPWPAESDEA